MNLAATNAGANHRYGSAAHVARTANLDRNESNRLGATMRLTLPSTAVTSARSLHRQK